MARCSMPATSLPSLGAWIETCTHLGMLRRNHRRSLHWERGLKPHRFRKCAFSRRRSLHWERGLKQEHGMGSKEAEESLPSLGAWIETP